MILRIWIENGIDSMYMIWDFCVTGNEFTIETIIYGSHRNNLNSILADLNTLPSG